MFPQNHLRERKERFKMENELMHFGVKGQRWGVRRYQNPDGSLTPKGKRRITKMTNALNKKYSKYKSNERENSELLKLSSYQQGSNFHPDSDIV